MKANTRNEAWSHAINLFPTDFDLDNNASERAGYKIFKSTADGNNSWISDLGNRLELNICGDDGRVESTNIWIEDEPKQENPNRVNAIRVQHWYSDEWCKDECATSQERLQSIAKQIRDNCKLDSIKGNDDYICSIYKNDNLGIKYYIKDTFGHISEIDEARSY